MDVNKGKKQLKYLKSPNYFCFQNYILENLSI